MGLFIQLLDRETDLDPHWWFNYGSLTLLNFTAGFFTPDLDRSMAMGALREVLEKAISRGQVSEDFLISSLKRELDEFVRGKEDPSVYNGLTDRMRNAMEEVIADLGARERWRQALTKVDPKYANKTDDELIADAHDALENSVTTRHLVADEAASRWADATEWWELSARLLPDEIFKHWGRLNTLRQVEESRQSDGQ